MQHYTTFWDERGRPNVALFHFEDYLRDLPGEVKRLAAHLGIAVTDRRAEELADEASLERSRSRAADIAPDVHLGLWMDPARFFRVGTSGQWATQMTTAQQQRYERLIAEITPPDLVRWMHHGYG